MNVNAASALEVTGGVGAEHAEIDRRCSVSLESKWEAGTQRNFVRGFHEHPRFGVVYSFAGEQVFELIYRIESVEGGAHFRYAIDGMVFDVVAENFQAKGSTRIIEVISDGRRRNEFKKFVRYGVNSLRLVS